MSIPNAVLSQVKPNLNLKFYLKIAASLQFPPPIPVTPIVRFIIRAVSSLVCLFTLGVFCSAVSDVLSAVKS